MFFIQRAAIDVLLLNKATALEICTYLVISKYTDRYGYYSGVGYRTIKERLGVGQKKVDIAIERLRNMEYEGQRLLYSLGEWVTTERVNTQSKIRDVGWVRGWFESEYNHQVWLDNDLVGSNGDRNSPLKYFTRLSGHDNHIRLLLLLYKYSNRQYSGVNIDFASIRTDVVSSVPINDVTFHKSIMSDYHISGNILNLFDIFLSEKETSVVFDELQKNGFLNVSLSVLGEHNGPDIPAGKAKRQLSISSPKRARSAKQKEAYKNYLEFLEDFQAIKKVYPDLRYSSKLAVKYNDKNNYGSFLIKLKKVLKISPLVELSLKSFEPLAECPARSPMPEAKFVYCLDYKSIRKRDFKSRVCLGTKIEEIILRCGLKPASRNGNFYKSYWWIEPQINTLNLVGVLMPAYTKYAEHAVHSTSKTVIELMISEYAYKIGKVEKALADEIVPRV